MIKVRIVSCKIYILMANSLGFIQGSCLGVGELRMRDIVTLLDPGRSG